MGMISRVFRVLTTDPSELEAGPLGGDPANFVEEFRPRLDVKNSLVKLDESRVEPVEPPIPSFARLQLL